MTIIDAQVHIWGADTAEQPWPQYGRSYTHRPEPFGKDALLREMDAAGMRLTRFPCSYRQAVTFFTDELDFLAAANKE
jgi:hypothetical protein